MLLAIDFLLPLLAVTATGVDDEARFPYWEVRDNDVSIRFVQRLPDQTRAFFLARGFKLNQIESAAQSCVFQTIVRNTSTKAAPATLTYNLRDWVIHAGGAKHKMKTREDWKPVHEASGVSPPARLAFDWALFPTRQEYNAGDYGWGMSVFGLKPGTRFDLDLVWQQDGRPRRVRLKGIECAPDIHPEPSAE